MHAVNCVRLQFLALSVTFLFVYEISRGNPLNTFAPCSQGSHVWSLTRTSLNVKVKVTRDKNGIFGPLSSLHVVCLVKHL